MRCARLWSKVGPLVLVHLGGVAWQVQIQREINGIIGARATSFLQELPDSLPSQANVRVVPTDQGYPTVAAMAQERGEELGCCMVRRIDCLIGVSMSWCLHKLLTIKGRNSLHKNMAVTFEVCAHKSHNSKT